MKILLLFTIALINEIHSKRSEFFGISYVNEVENYDIFSEFYFRFEFSSKKFKSFSMTYGRIFNYKEHNDIFFRIGAFISKDGKGGKISKIGKVEFGISLLRKINISVNLLFSKHLENYGIDISYISSRYKRFAIDIGVSLKNTKIICFST